MELFEREIMREDNGEIVKSIFAKYEAINERLGRSESDRLKYGIWKEDFDKTSCAK